MPDNGFPYKYDYEACIKKVVKVRGTIPVEVYTTAGGFTAANLSV